MSSRLEQDMNIKDFAVILTYQRPTKTVKKEEIMLKKKCFQREVKKSFYMIDNILGLIADVAGQQEVTLKDPLSHVGVGVCPVYWVL